MYKSSINSLALDSPIRSCLVTVLFLQVQALLQENHLAESLKRLEEGFRVWPDTPCLHYGMGMAQLKIGQLQLVSVVKIWVAYSHYVLKHRNMKTMFPSSF